MRSSFNSSKKMGINAGPDPVPKLAAAAAVSFFCCLHPGSKTPLKNLVAKTLPLQSFIYSFPTSCRSRWKKLGLSKL